MLLGKGGWKAFERKARPIYLVVAVVVVVANFVFFVFIKDYPPDPTKTVPTVTTVASAVGEGCGNRGACCPNDSARFYMDQGDDDDFDHASYDIPNKAYWCFNNGRIVPSVLPRYYDPSKDFDFYWAAFWIRSDLDLYWPENP